VQFYPKLLAGQSISLETFVVPVGDPNLKVARQGFLTSSDRLLPRFLFGVHLFKEKGK
jgi:hypothetical protein